MPTMQGTDAWEPAPERRRRRLRAGLPGHRSGAAGQDADVGVRLQRVGRASPARARAQSVESRLHRGGVVVGRRRVRRRRRGADRARQRRRRLDPDPGRRATDWSGSSRRAAGCRWTSRPPDAGAHRRERGGHPLRARHRRVLPRSRAGLPQPASCRRSATSPARASSGCASRCAPNPLMREASPEIRELTLKTAALLEELGHKVTEIDNPVPRPLPGRLPAVLVSSWRSRSCAADAACSAELRPQPSWTT